MGPTTHGAIAGLPVAGTSTVGEYLERWLAHAQARVRACTYRSYEATIRCHVRPALGALPLDELHPLHLQDLYAALLNGSPEKPPRPVLRAISPLPRKFRSAPSTVASRSSTRTTRWPWGSRSRKSMR